MAIARVVTEARGVRQDSQRSILAFQAPILPSNKRKAAVCISCNPPFFIHA
jgi:hypothetical protein